MQRGHPDCDGGGAHRAGASRTRERPEAGRELPGARASPILEGPRARPGGQTFTPAIAGELSTAEIAVSNFATVPGDYRIDINAVDGTGIPTNDILASTTIPDTAVPDGQSTVTASFGHPAQVATGQQYALIITRPASDNLQVGIRFGDDCAGQLFLSDSQTASFSAQTLAGEDLVFNVFVTPAPPTPAEDQAPPETQITKYPKDKTKKKTATFEFTERTRRDVRVLARRRGVCDCSSPVTLRSRRASTPSRSGRRIRQATSARLPPTPGSGRRRSSNCWDARRRSPPLFAFGKGITREGTAPTARRARCVRRESTSGGAARDTARAMSQENVEVVRRMFAAFRDGDWTRTAFEPLIPTSRWTHPNSNPGA